MHCPIANASFLYIPLVFIYPLFVVVCPQNIVKRIQSTFDSFLWRDGAHKVPKCILELPVRMGGISYPNVERIFKSTRLSWTREIFSGENNSQVSTKKFYLMLKPPSLDRVMEDSASRKTPIYTRWFDEIGPTKWPNVFKGLYENTL